MQIPRCGEYSGGDNRGSSTARVECRLEARDQVATDASLLTGSIVDHHMML